MKSVARFRSKPTGWWTTHPTMLSVSVHGAFDGNGDGLGDFEGVRQKLDFFIDMGVSAYRFQHVGVYGEDYKWSGLVQQDWYNVDPHYGTMADFDRLMKECRGKDIKVIMMSVPEYLGWHHPDYLAAMDARRKGIDDPRVDWFEWKDDGTVLTCWDRPGPNVANPAYMNAFLKHVGFWMDKGVAGWDCDAVGTWHHLDLETLRRLTGFVIARHGFVTAENMVLLNDVTKFGGFNAATGYLRSEFYNELKAICEHRADYIRDALKVRDELINLGMFPYQQFGDQSFKVLTNSWFCHIDEMFKLQVAFNAALPDQVWILADALTFSDNTRPADPKDKSRSYGTIDWNAIGRQEQDPSSVFSHVKRMFRLRAENKELAVGHIEEVPTNHPQDVFAALRTSEDFESSALVVFNFSESYRDVVVILGAGKSGNLVNYLNGERLVPVDGSICLHLYPYGFKFLKWEERATLRGEHDPPAR